jgi:hypothetical protein
LVKPERIAQRDRSPGVPPFAGFVPFDPSKPKPALSVEQHNKRPMEFPGMAQDVPEFMPVFGKELVSFVR